MKSDETPMYDDPTTPMHVRDLIAAGRRGTSDYDVERGLAEHLIRIGAALPTAPVAPPLAPSAHWAPAATAATAAVKSHLPAWFGFVALPLAAAGVAGLLWLFSADRAAAPKGGSASSSAAVPAAIEVGASTQAHANANDAPSEAAGVRVPSVRGPARTPSAAMDRSVAAAEEREARAANDARYDRRSRGSARPSHNGTRGARGANGRAFEGDNELGSSTGVAAASDLNGSDSSRSNAAPADSADKSNAAEEARTSPAANAAASSARNAAEEAAEPEAPAKASRQASAKPPAPVIDESRLEREMQMLAVTQRVLSSDPGRALRLSEQGEREFAGSMFSAERRQLGLLALVKLGRIDEARRAGRPFLARYPNAPWSERLRRALTTGVID